MHVLFLPSWYPETFEDISGSFFREQALALHQAGCKVGVIAPGMLLSLRRPLHALRADRSIRKEMDAGVPTYRMTAINWTPRLRGRSARRKEHIRMALYRAYAAVHGRPDVIHVHASLPAGAAAIGIAKQANIPYVLSEHGSAYARGLIPAAGIRMARAEVRSAMADSDAFVLSSKYETFGVVLVEALAMGLPLIATQCGGPEDIVTSDTGILVPTEDADALASAMAQICESRTQWPAEKLRADCAARFGPDVVSQRWIGHYERLIASEGMAE